MIHTLVSALDTIRDGLRAQLDWEREGADWPNRSSSRFVRAGGFRWHVQQMGEGPDLLLLHGTGSSTHSYRELAPLLARDFRVTLPDLPGHGFTDRPRGGAVSMNGMARGLEQLLGRLDVSPDHVVGHSAGAAVLCRMSLDGQIDPEEIIGIAGALMPLSSWSRSIWSPLARALVSVPTLPRLLAWRAEDPRVVGAMLRDTGSRLDRRGIELYTRLWASPRHVGSTLAMMAAWDLESLARDLPQLDLPLHLLVPGEDRFIPAADAQRVRAIAPRGETIVLPDLGHLAHEEAPERIAERIAALVRAGHEGDRRDSLHTPGQCVEGRVRPRCDSRSEAEIPRRQR